MIQEEAYIAYFQNLAANHNQVQDGVANNKSFFYLQQPYDTTEIDNAIRNSAGPSILALESMKGRIDDLGAKSYTQFIDGQFMVLVKATKGLATSIRPAKDLALKIGTDILARIVIDSNAHVLINTDPGTRFTMHNLNFQPVGPMELLYYGYAFTFTITCPFGFTVTNATWLDK